jgi:protein ImuA
LDCRNERELLAAAEEGLRNVGLATLLVEVSRSPDMTAARRLQLAAEAGGALGLLLCPGPMGRHGAITSGAMAPDEWKNTLPPSPAVSRWRAGHAPAGPEGKFRWRLELLRCRGGGTGEWLVDWHEKTRRLDLVASAGD